MAYTINLCMFKVSATAILNGNIFREKTGAIDFLFSSHKLDEVLGLALAVDFGLFLVFVELVFLLALAGDLVRHAHSKVDVGRGHKAEAPADGLQVQRLDVKNLKIKSRGSSSTILSRRRHA